MLIKVFHNLCQQAHRYSDFKLTAQLRKDVPGFDDAIFGIKMENQGQKFDYICVQIKHKEKEGSTIKFDSLFPAGGTGDFSLLQYFKRYLKEFKNPFPDGNVSKFVIYTNKELGIQKELSDKGLVFENA